MESRTCKLYIEDCTENWSRMGFRPVLDYPEYQTTYRRRRFVLSELRVVDTFCVATCMEEITADDFVTFSRNGLQVAFDNRFFLPGTTVIAYPLVVVQELAEEVRHFVTQRYMPKHRAGTVFPCVYALNTGELIYQQTAGKREFREEAEHLFGFV